MSASSTPTLWPCWARATARLTVIERLADAALAGRDRDDLGRRVGGREADVHLRVRRAALGAQVRRQLLAFLVGHRPEHDLDVVDVGQLHDRVGDVAGDAVLERAARHGQLDAHGDAPALDHHLVDHAELGDRLVDLGVVDGRQNGENLVLGGHAAAFFVDGSGGSGTRRQPVRPAAQGTAGAGPPPPTPRRERGSPAGSGVVRSTSS